MMFRLLNDKLKKYFLIMYLITIKMVKKITIKMTITMNNLLQIDKKKVSELIKWVMRVPVS